jgi:hypothetical protein
VLLEDWRARGGPIDNCKKETVAARRHRASARQGAEAGNRPLPPSHRTVRRFRHTGDSETQRRLTTSSYQICGRPTQTDGRSDRGPHQHSTKTTAGPGVTRHVPARPHVVLTLPRGPGRVAAPGLTPVRRHRHGVTAGARATPWSRFRGQAPAVRYRYPLAPQPQHTSSIGFFYFSSPRSAASRHERTTLLAGEQQPSSERHVSTLHRQHVARETGRSSGEFETTAFDACKLPRSG